VTKRERERSKRRKKRALGLPKRAKKEPKKRPRPKPRPKPTKRPAPRKPPTKASKKPRMRPWPPKQPPESMRFKPTLVERLEKVEKKLSAEERRALEKLPPRARVGALRAIVEEQEEERVKKIRRERSEKKKKEEKKEERQANKALSQLRKAVKAADKDGGKLYGEYNEHTHKRQNVKGTFSGFKRIPFDERAEYIQEEFKTKYGAEWRRDLLVQGVHVKEYLVFGDGGAGRRAIIEKVLIAGRKCLEEQAVDSKGKPLRVYQIYIGMIRVLVRKEDAGRYGGYSTRPIGGKKIGAVTDIRGLEGFEKVSPGEDPKVALDRLLERLENHLDDILDGLPVVYVKSLQIKFDVEGRD
jgi:hypothetical protein